MIEDERFRSGRDRVEHMDALDDIVGGYIGTKTLQENLEHFEAAGVTAGPICDPTDLIDYEYIRGRGGARHGRGPLIVPESLTNLTDLDAFEAAAALGRRIGSEGGFAAHPGQVGRLNRVFTPAEEEVTAAERVIAVARQVEIDGKGTVRHEGCMIEAPIIMRAERLLARAKRFR